jgi:hypothetical protein
MDKNKATSPEKKAALEAIRAEFKGTDSQTQRTRLLTALQSGMAVSTYEARLYLDIYYPPARIMELRDDGQPITTHWQSVITEAGDTHRVGLYLMDREANNEAAI